MNATNAANRLTEPFSKTGFNYNIRQTLKSWDFVNSRTPTIYTKMTKPGLFVNSGQASNSPPEQPAPTDPCSQPAGQSRPSPDPGLWPTAPKAHSLIMQIQPPPGLATKAWGPRQLPSTKRHRQRTTRVPERRSGKELLDMQHRNRPDNVL